MKTFLYPLAIVLFSGILSLFLGKQGICSSSFPLDSETVFCIYYKMSGEDMEEQDLEELCFSSGRPTFSAFKPSEVFMKNDLRRLRHALTKRMKEYGKNSIFKWGFKCILMPNKPEINTSKLIFLNNKMPQPTPFISPEITKRGQRSARKVLDALISKSLNKSGDRVLNVILYLKPERIEFRYKKRNIAHEDVCLPFRYVIFHPVRIEVFPFKHPDQMLVSRNIPTLTTY